MLNTKGEYISYPGCTEVVKGVYVSDDGDVYIHDVEGEVMGWTHDELAEDPKVASEAMRVVALASKRGAKAVRENITSRGTTMGSLIKHTQWIQGML